jgi:hypothetical protein
MIRDTKRVKSSHPAAGARGGGTRNSNSPIKLLIFHSPTSASAISPEEYVFGFRFILDLGITLRWPPELISLGKSGGIVYNLA